MFANHRGPLAKVPPEFWKYSSCWVSHPHSRGGAVTWSGITGALRVGSNLSNWAPILASHVDELEFKKSGEILKEKKIRRRMQYNFGCVLYVEEAIQNSTQFVLVIMRSGSGNACIWASNFLFILFIYFIKYHMISFSRVLPLSDELIRWEEASGLSYLWVTALHQELHFFFFQSFFSINCSID